MTLYQEEVQKSDSIYCSLNLSSVYFPLIPPPRPADTLPREGNLALQAFHYTHTLLNFLPTCYEDQRTMRTVAAMC